MAIEAKEVITYIRKCVLFSIKTSYRSVCSHPYISGVVFVLLMLYSIFPSLFAFLVSSFPVIVCTAILLGTLLSYGTPSIPNIERENKKTYEVSSLQVRSVIDDLVIKKDESLTVEACEQTSSEVDEGTLNDEALSEATSSAGNEAVRELCFPTMHDEGVYRDLPASSFVSENMKETENEKNFTEEREVCAPALVERGEFAAEKQPEVVLRLDEDVADLSVKDQKEGEGLTVQIAKPTPDNLFDSTLGSPWEQIDSHDASSSSDSDSGESSSPDASMADIIPMLDELHPLLDSEHPQATPSATGYSDAASSESSQDEDSDDGSAEAEAKNNEDKGKEEVQEEKHESNEDAVTWNADDQRSVMDLGVSELERNRRLESLIAKRRARKLQRFQTEKNLIDLDSYYPTPIPSISAPRRNPFDLSYDPFPGSAPSVLQPRQNPFDLPYEQVEKYGILSREYLSHQDFVLGPQEDISKRRHGISTLGTSFSNYFHREKDNSKLKPYLFAERMDSEESEFTAFQKQLSAMGDSKSSYVSEFDKVSSVTGQENYKQELLEPLVHQKSNLSSDKLDAHHVKQDGQSFEEVDSVDVEHTQRSVNLGDDRAINLNTSIVVEGTRQQTDSFSAVEEVDEAPTNFPLSYLEKLVDTERRYEESDSSSEESEKSFGLGIHEESANLEHTRYDSMQSDGDIDIPDANPVYDSSPSAVGKTLSNASILDESLLTEGKEDFIYSPLPSDVQADFSEVVSPQKPLEMDPPYEDRDYMEVSRSMGEELASGCGGHYIASSIVSSQDEIESKSRERTEIKECDAILVEISKASEDATESAAGEIMPSLSLFTVNSESGGGWPSNMDTLSEGNNIMDEPPSMKDSAIHSPSEAELEDSQVRKLELPSIPEENLVDSNFEEEHESTVEPSVVSGTTGLQVIKEPDLCLYDTKQEPSSGLKSAEGIGNYIDTKLVHKEENNDAPVISSSIPSHDGHVTGMHFLEPTESTEFSILSKITTEIEMESNNALSHSGGNIIDEVQSRACLEYLNHSDEESDAEIYAGATEIKEFDEDLLAELDAVGDFSVDKEPKPDQGDSDEESQFKSHFDSIKVSSAEMQDSPSQVQYSEARPLEDVNTSIGLLSEDTSGISNKVNPVEDRTTMLEYGVLPSSIMASCEDPEMTVYNSKLHVLEACSLEELDSVFKQLSEKAVEPSSELTFDSSETSKSGVKASELDLVDQEPKQSETNPQHLVLEAKSAEDITLALKQVSEAGLHEPSFSEVEPSEDLPVGTHSEPTETNAELEILEAKSLEDIDLALKQLSGGIKNLNPPSLMEHKDGFTEAETSQSHHESEIQSAAASERNLEPEHNEVQYCEQMDSKEDVVEESGMAVQKVDEKSDKNIVTPAVSDSTASESRKSWKKGKSDKSDSSSSSSSSSDSD